MSGQSGEREQDRARADADQGLSCEEASVLSSAALDGEIDEAEEARLAQHLARCGACARQRAEMVLLEGLLAPRVGLGEREALPDWAAVGAFVAQGADRRGERGAPAGEAPWSASSASARERASSSGRLAGPRRYGPALGHPLARAVAAVLVVVGASIAIRGFAPSGWFPLTDEAREEAAVPATLPTVPASPALPSAGHPAPATSAAVPAPSTTSASDRDADPIDATSGRAPDALPPGAATPDATGADDLLPSERSQPLPARVGGAR